MSGRCPESCAQVISGSGLYSAQFYGLNPALVPATCLLTAGQKICVANGPQCTKKVVSAPTNTGGCTALASQNALSIQAFFALNPFLKADCSNLLAGDSVCVAGPAQTASAVCSEEHTVVLTTCGGGAVTSAPAPTSSKAAVVTSSVAPTSSTNTSASVATGSSDGAAGGMNPAVIGGIVGGVILLVGAVAVGIWYSRQKRSANAVGDAIELKD
ncbi:hypothetical protein BJ741DRAFT_586409 [Chytriomyces cf. hyalinus JEL632]|nr:hypothetical protein BJ741DRAFT_586409 [Chytriomyces cf. hyalinus JEL632]